MFIWSLGLQDSDTEPWECFAAPGDDFALDPHPTHIFPLNRRTETENCKLNETIQIHGEFVRAMTRSSIASVVQMQANYSPLAIMCYVFTLTFAYLIGATSCLRCRYHRESPAAFTESS